MASSSPIVNVNVIGAGRWGPNIIRNFATGRDSRVGIVCDLDTQRLALLSDRFPSIRITTNSHDAIHDESADAVAIATPLATHFALASEALSAGKDVLVEKPLAQSSAECEQLIALAHGNDSLLMVGHVFEYNPGIEFVKTLIDSGELGKIVAVHAVRTNLGPVRRDTNALWDLGAHDLSVFRYWLGVEPVTAAASGLRYLSDHLEDTVQAAFTYQNGVMATIHASWLNPRKVREITVVGEKKMVVWDDLNLDAPVHIYDKGIDLDRNDYTDTFGAFRLSIRDGNVLIPPVRGEEPLASECNHFIQCVKSRETPKSDGHDGLSVVRALEAASRSLAEGGQMAHI